MPASLLGVLDRPVAGHVLERLRACGFTDIAVDGGAFADDVDAALGEHAALRAAALVRAGDPAPAVALRPAAPDVPVLVVRGEVLAADDLRAFAAAHVGAGVVVARHGAIHVATLLDPDALDVLGDRSLAGAADTLRALGVAITDVELPGPAHAVDSVAGLLATSFAAMRGELGVTIGGTELDDGLVVGDGTALDGVAMVEPPVWIGADVEIGVNARLHGPVIIGAGATIGDGALLKEAIVLPGATLLRETLLAGGIGGRAGGVVASAPEPGPYAA